MKQIDYLHLFNFAGDRLRCNNGRQLNFVDYSIFFAEKYNITSKFLSDTIQKEIFDTSKDFFFDPSIKKLRNKFEFNYEFIKKNYFDSHHDILICDFNTLCVLIDQDIHINYNQIYIFDCVELTLFLQNINTISTSLKHFEKIDSTKIQNYINENKSKITFFITHFNEPEMKLLDFNYEIYYKKINFSLFNKNYINDLKKSDDLIYYYAKQNESCEDFDLFIEKIQYKYPNIILTNDFMEIWNHKNILYTPKPYVEYIEQFGRMIFELTYFGYNVIIDNSMKNKKTGLDYYLEYYKTNDINLMNEDFFDGYFK